MTPPKKIIRWFEVPGGVAAALNKYDRIYASPKPAKDVARKMRA